MTAAFPPRSSSSQPTVRRQAAHLDPAVVHVDLDAFFAAVEVLDDPSLAGRPVIVGGTGGRGVVAACTYEARAFGVHSAMPSARARRLCPEAVFVQGRYDRYAQLSARLHEVFARFTPRVEGIGLDEAFLDVAGARRLLGSGEQIAWAIRQAVKADLGLEASVGVASTKLVAKLASEAAKPVADRRGTCPGAGVVVVAPGTEEAFLHPQPVRALWGVGPATYARLERFGVATIGDLAAVPVASLVAALGPSLGRHLHDLAWGRDPRPVGGDGQPRSVSHEETYARDLHDGAQVAVELLRLADGVAGRLRQAGLAGRTVTLKVRFHDFATITRSRTLPAAVDTAGVIARTAGDLMAGLDPGPGIRLLGLCVSSLTSGVQRQLSLLDDLAVVPGVAPACGAVRSRDAEWERVTVAIDRIRYRFGDSAVGPVALMQPLFGSQRLRRKRRGDTQWGPGRGG